jgi:hypothetical protein
MPEGGGGDVETAGAGEEYVEYGDGGAADDSDEDDTKIRVPRFSVPADDVENADEEMKSGADSSDRPAEDLEDKKRKPATRPAEVIPPKASKKKRMEARYSGSVVPLLASEPTFSLLSSPMPTLHPGISGSAMPRVPTPTPALDLQSRYNWIRASASYVHDLTTMASMPTGQYPDTSPDEWCPDILGSGFSTLQLRRFALFESPLTLPAGTVMGVNPSLDWSPSFVKGQEDRLMRSQMNGVPVQRDTVKTSKAKVSRADLSPFYPAYGVSKSVSTAVIASYDDRLLDDYFAYLETRPWDEMYRQRVRVLYTMDPTTLSPASQRWLRWYFQFMFHQRQAFWEHYHWLHTGTKSARREVPWVVFMERRDFLAKHLTRAWSVLMHLRPRDFPRDYHELLISEPAFWYRPHNHCTWVPGMKSLRADPPVSLAEQVSTLDSEEPIRVQYAGYESRVVESFKARAQLAMRYHHYVGATWTVPSQWQDPDYPLEDSDLPSIGTPGPDFYRVDYDAARLAKWDKQSKSVSSGLELMSDIFDTGTGVEVMKALFRSWDSDAPVGPTPSPASPPAPAGAPRPKPGKSKREHDSSDEDDEEEEEEEEDDDGESGSEEDGGDDGDDGEGGDAPSWAASDD